MRGVAMHGPGQGHRRQALHREKPSTAAVQHSQHLLQLRFRSHQLDRPSCAALAGLVCGGGGTSQKEVLPGFEPGLQESESWVLTTTL